MQYQTLTSTYMHAYVPVHTHMHTHSNAVKLQCKESITSHKSEREQTLPQPWLIFNIGSILMC